MALKKYKPTTPGQRGLIQVDRSGLHTGKPVKHLTEGLTKSGGRNNTGRITARRRGPENSAKAQPACYEPHLSAPKCT